MLKNIVMTVAGGGAVALSTGFPHQFLTPAAWVPQHEPQVMLLLATVLFGAASAVRRVRRTPRRQR